MKTGLLIGQLDDGGNQSALIRTAEAFGINNVFAVKDRDTYIHSTVSRGSEKHVTVEEFESYSDFVFHCYDNNYSIVSIENTPDAEPIERKVDYPTNPIFVVGNESEGVPEGVMRHTDTVVKISQSPNSYIRCLNTTVSGSIVMHDWYDSMMSEDKTQKYEIEAGD